MASLKPLFRSGFRSGSLPGWLNPLLAVLAGSLVPLSLAPFNLWPLGLLGVTGLALLLQGQSAARAWWLALLFGLGLYTLGTSWVYVSIHGYGNASAPLAVLLTGLFVAFMALVFSLPFYLYGRWFSQHAISLLLAFPALWLLGEWVRSWLLTGFPWLYLGYGHLDTWLAGWAPVVGVMGLSLALCLTAGLAAYWLWHWRRDTRAGRISLLLLLLWPLGLALKPLDWTQPQGAPVSIGMVQPNIPQELKWRPDFVQPTLDRLQRLSKGLWDRDLIIWPEAAIPQVYHQMQPFMKKLETQASTSQTGVISGIIYDDLSAGQSWVYHNTLVGLGKAQGLYHKQRLVPFGEYVPLEAWLRGLIDFFDLPTSVITAGPARQPGLQLGEVTIAPFICYEIVYPDQVARDARGSQLLLTVSNDAWFADSIGPLQHLQMAQMRALETGRELARSTNNGVSALIDHKGRIKARGEQFVEETLSGELQPRSGLTPFMRWGTWPMLFLAVGLLVLAFGRGARNGGRRTPMARRAW